MLLRGLAAGVVGRRGGGAYYYYDDDDYYYYYDDYYYYYYYDDDDYYYYYCYHTANTTKPSTLPGMSETHPHYPRGRLERGDGGRSLLLRL